MSLLDRPAEMPRQVTSLTPKKWPDISVKTEMLTRTGKRALLDEHLYGDDEAAIANAKDDPINWYDWPPIDLNGDVLPSTGLAIESVSLDDVLGEELPSLLDESAAEHGLQELSSIRRMWRRLRAERPSSLSRLSDAPFSPLNCYPHFLEIEFPGSVKDKTLSTVLAHAFGYDLGERPSVTAAAPSGSLAHEAVAQQKTSSTSGDQPAKIFAATGADLHLIEFGMLQRLARLYRLPVDDVGRSALERSLCKFFSNRSESSPTSMQVACILENEPPIHGRYRAFTKGSLPKRSKGGEPSVVAGGPSVPPKTSHEDWTAADDQLLLSQVERVSRARQQIALALDHYLRTYDTNEDHGSAGQRSRDVDVEPLESASGDAIVMGEAVNLWEVVSKCFPQGDYSAKGCKKRWRVLQRLQCLDNGFRNK